MRCERLDVWKRACRLSVEVYQHFEDSKAFSFKDQITRSALSIASNIAEGMEKDSDKEKIRYIEIARGSSAELATQVYIGIEIEKIDRTKGFAWIREIDELAKMLTSLKKSIAQHLALNAQRSEKNHA